LRQGNISIATESGISIGVSTLESAFALLEPVASGVRNVLASSDTLSLAFAQPEVAIAAARGARAEAAALLLSVSQPEAGVEAARNITVEVGVNQIGGMPFLIFADGQLAIRLTGKHYLKL
jgi:hypothetical protein